MPNSNQMLQNALTAIGISLDTNSIEGLNSVSKLCLDSRKVDKHTVFIGLSSSNFESDHFVKQAFDNHAPFAIIETDIKSDNGQLISNDATKILKVYDLRSKLYDFAHGFYFENGDELPNIIAITGTNGKTSIASLTCQLASLTGEKTVSIGTLGVTQFNNGKPTKIDSTINTTPDLLTIMYHLKQASSNGCDLVSIEASSHGLEQNRLGGLPINCGIFTNLSQDHLDYHQDMKHYALAKRKLLKQPKIRFLVLNADDHESTNWLQSTPDGVSVSWYSLSNLTNTKRGYWANKISYGTDGISFELCCNCAGGTTELFSMPVKAPLIGQFNVSNILATIASLHMQGFDLEMLASNVDKLMSVDGRMEIYPSARATMLVDYAHTPDALEQALKASRVHTKGNLICVFGCGGNRDKIKRALMGKAADTYCDRVVLTNDNPRNEDPMSIVSDIQQGITKLSKLNCVDIELDREQAIIKALKNTTSDDLILIAGKGHETYIEVNNQQVFYDERALVARLSDTNLKGATNSFDAKSHSNSISSRECL